MRHSFLLILSVFFLLVACSKQPPPSKTIVGADRDAHGCIPSAGYSWCDKTSQCERPWELAKQQGFPNTAEAFTEFCAGN